MHHRSGFMLIEIMLFLYVTILVGMVVNQWIISAIKNSKESAKGSSLRMQIHTAHDRMIHDIKMAPPARDAWKKITPTALIWQAKEGDCGYLFAGKTLTRITGTFNQTTDSWHRATKSVLITSLSDMRWDVMYGHDVIEGVTVTYMPDNKTRVVQQIRLCSRSIP